MENIGWTADGAVVLNRHNSHLHEDSMATVVEALQHINTADRQFIEAEIDLRHVIGFSSCVNTGPEDKIIYAQRINRKGLTRFVVGRDAEPTSKVMIVLKKTNKPKEYILITGFLGGKAEVEPWDPRATETSIIFWQGKALIWDGQITEGTTTTECPW